MKNIKYQEILPDIIASWQKKGKREGSQRYF